MEDIAQRGAGLGDRGGKASKGWHGQYPAYCALNRQPIITEEEFLEYDGYEVKQAERSKPLIKDSLTPHAVHDSRDKTNRSELESQRHFHALLEKPYKPLKLKQLDDKIREQYSKSQFMREYRETHEADPGYHQEKADF